MALPVVLVAATLGAGLLALCVVGACVAVSHVALRRRVAPLGRCPRLAHA